ncbi:AAA family ATPase [Candidatus Amarobacter glycogenicus]|uniref:AAA family ATPase n=1 Tax=Candidatus Amarobacter glycogenicus TaxID=3140699 RepID=UPI0031CC86C3
MTLTILSSSSSGQGGAGAVYAALSPVLIDEMQYAADLLPYIKLASDRAQRPGLFWLTGSQQFHLMQGVSESLAGRVAVLHLLGLSRRERLGQGREIRPFLPTPAEIQQRMGAGGKLTLRELYRLIWRGALPAIALDDAVERDLFYGSACKPACSATCATGARR